MNTGIHNMKSEGQKYMHANIDTTKYGIYTYIVCPSHPCTIREQLTYCVYKNSSRYIDCCLLYGRCSLLGVSVNGGSTVHALGSKLTYFFYNIFVNALGATTVGSKKNVSVS